MQGVFMPLLPIRLHRQKNEDHYYKPVRVDNFYGSNYIEHESNGDRNKKLSVKEYLNEIKPYQIDITIDIQKSGT